MSMVALKYLTVAAATKHTATVIFVHVRNFRTCLQMNLTRGHAVEYRG